MAQHWHCNFGVSPMDTRQEAKQPLKSASFGREKLHQRKSFGPCSLVLWNMANIFFHSLGNFHPSQLTKSIIFRGRRKTTIHFRSKIPRGDGKPTPSPGGVFFMVSSLRSGRNSNRYVYVKHDIYINK